MKSRITSNQDHGTAMFRYWLIFGIMLSIVLGGTVFSKQVEAAGRTIYVDHEATGTGDGSNWHNAYTDLQAAIDAAVSGDQILVADGTYYPTGNGTGRDVHFTLKNGVAIYGGQIGLRGYGTETILSGNIGDPSVSSDNAYHVIKTSGLDHTAILSGVTIQGGRAVLYGLSQGGGIYNKGSSPTIKNIIIRGNTAIYGAGIANTYGSSPSLTNVIISGNNAIKDSGAGGVGGGVYNLHNSDPKLTNVLITGNKAAGRGGGIFNLYDSDPVLTNVTVSGNKASSGGGMRNDSNDNHPIVRNSIFSANSSGNWSNASGSTVTVDVYSIVGSDASTLFVNPVSYSSAPTSAGDYRLKAGSAAINAGTGSYYDVGGTPDLSVINYDLDGKPRTLSGAVDVGAYEYDYVDITAAAAPVAGGRITGDGAYKWATVATVTANVYAGYTFVNWTEGGVEVSTYASYSFIVNDNRTLTANFEPIMRDITVSAVPPVWGSVSGGGSVQETQDATVTANANDGYAFVNWTEGGAEVSTDASYTFTVTGDRTLTANFEPIMHDITVTAGPAAWGSVSGGGSVQETLETTVTAHANDTYTFVNWTESGVEVSTDASYTFTVTGDRTLTANFAPIMHDITMIADPVAGGTMSGGGSVQVTHDTTVTAHANDGYAFVNWTENGAEVSTDASYTSTVTGDRTLTANFEPIMHDITVTADPAAGGTVSGGSVQETLEATVTANANGGYTFVNWTESGTEVSTDASYTFTVTGDRTLTANFEAVTSTPSSSPPSQPSMSVCDNLCYFKKLHTANVNLQVRWQQTDREGNHLHLNWKGTAQSGELAYYILFRDGQEIYRGLETNYTDNILSMGSYVYTLFVVSSEGERSNDSMFIWTDGHTSLKYTVNVNKNQSFEYGELTLNLTAGSWIQSFELSMEDTTIQSQELVPQSSTLLSPIYQILKTFEGQFLKPLELQIVYQAGSLPASMVPAIVYFDEDTNQWVQLNGTIKGNAITAQVDHFTKFAVLAVKRKVEFNDIAKHWAEDGIMRAADQDLVHGFPDGAFRPNESITRAQFATMLANTLGMEATTDKLSFKDASSISEFALESLTYLVHEGIIHGYPDETLRPNQTITREEMAVMLTAALKLKLNEPDNILFRDDYKISNFARASVNSAVQSGYLKGRDQNLFAPQSTLTRAEAAVLMLSIFDRLPK